MLMQADRRGSNRPQPHPPLHIGYRGRAPDAGFPSVLRLTSVNELARYFVMGSDDDHFALTFLPARRRSLIRRRLAVESHFTGKDCAWWK
jgi:hypothetical protein